MLCVLKRPLMYLFSGVDYRVKLYIRCIHYCKQQKKIRLAAIVANRLERKYGVFLSPKTDFHPSLRLRHPVGIVIGVGVKIGKDVIIYQNVTLGGARLGDGNSGKYPEIGDRTVIFSGAVIVGKIVIGKNCIIGANSVVLQNVPDNCTAVGAPAKIIRNTI